MKHKSYQYRLKPTDQQKQTLIEWGSATRWLWNYFLEQNKKKYDNEKSLYSKNSQLITHNV